MFAFLCVSFCVMVDDSSVPSHGINCYLVLFTHCFLPQMILILVFVVILVEKNAVMEERIGELSLNLPLIDGNMLVCLKTKREG